MILKYNQFYKIIYKNTWLDGDFQTCTIYGKYVDCGLYRKLAGHYVIYIRRFISAKNMPTMGIPVDNILEIKQILNPDSHCLYFVMLYDTKIGKALQSNI